MNDLEVGRVPAAPGSREPSPDGLGRSGFDPSREATTRNNVAALRKSNPALVAALFEAQRNKQCRVVTHRPPQTFSELSCSHQREYHTHQPHEFDGAITCESCKHMGRRYWGSDDHPVHFCGRRDERRADGFVHQGSFADNFMAEWRKSYDAGPTQWAEKCRYFEPRELPCDSDRNPEGRDAGERLGAEHESAGPEGIAQGQSHD